jgi:hypothetical protein
MRFVPKDSIRFGARRKFQNKTNAPCAAFVLKLLPNLAYFQFVPGDLRAGNRFP